MDWIVHPKIEKFKAAVMNLPVHGLTVEEWRTLLASGDDDAICDALASRLDIKEQAAKALVK
jgi:cation transport ATPase